MVVEPLEPQAPKWEGIPASEHVDTRIMELRRCGRDLHGSRTQPKAAGYKGGSGVVETSAPGLVTYQMTTEPPA